MSDEFNPSISTGKGLAQETWEQAKSFDQLSKQDFSEKGGIPENFEGRITAGAEAYMFLHSPCNQVLNFPSISTSIRIIIVGLNEHLSTCPALQQK